ncbi:MAG TPA: methyltransferase [Microlunatus sp.]
MDIRDLSDLRTAWCIHVVATLRIADHLAAGVSDLEELASAAECDPDALRRVLRHLAGHGVFTENGTDRFDLNDPARQLLDESLRSYLDLDGVGGRFAHAWGTLLPAVRTGRPAYAERFGLPFWQDLDAHPELRDGFDALMGPVGHGPPDPEVLLAGDWQTVHSIVDVGGGTGSLLAAILQAHPQSHGTLVDLPRTVANSAAVFAAAGVQDRVTVVGQSFFDPLPSGADLYLLSGVLNDWPEAETVRILARCAEAAIPSAGRVVIRGGVSPDESRSDELTVELVLLGGQNNALPKFRQLAAAAALEVTAAGQTPSGRFVVECRPSSG